MQKGCDMIHTVTFNPSIDVTIRLKRIIFGQAHVLEPPLEDAGGKGMNAARALQELGMPVTAWAFIAGRRGEHWLKLATRSGIPLYPAWLEGETRQNFKIFEEDLSRQTDLNFPGVLFDQKACQNFLHQIGESLNPGDIVVLAGSVLQETPPVFWKKLAEAVQGCQAMLVVDMAGQALREIAKWDPWLVKINREEFNEWMGKDFRDLAAIQEFLEKSNLLLSSHLVVTDGPHGALLKSREGSCVVINAPKVKVEGTVGAGDAFLAGLLTGWIGSSGIWQEAMRWGMATATGAVMMAGTRFPDRESVEAILEKYLSPSDAQD